MRSDLPTGTVTLLFTDIEGSTTLLRELGAAEYSRALAAHRRLLREACARSSGVEVDSQGDAFFAAFPTAQGAIGAAQTVIVELGSGPIRVRVGVHTGTPLLTEEGYIGADVHLAARLAASAHGGQIVVSRVTSDLLPDDIPFVDLGEHRLKDIEGPVSILQIGVEKFAPLKTLSNTNLPRPASSFVGRDRELAEVVGRLRNGARLLTLTGPGGIGKTRLAIEAAASLVPAYRSGVFWVALSTVRDPALLLEAVSRVLGAKGGLADHIQEREMLLLLDNLEQVIEASPGLSALLSSCPNLTLLVTSRERLRIQGEVAYPVPPLTDQAAVSLFCERAQTEPTTVIGDLCACLDSLPLAIELAAARVTAVSPNQILDRISHRLDLLRGGRDADPRQQTLRATIDWSYQLLTDGERELFRRMSVFAGGCTLDAAEAVAEASLDTLQLLVEKSLLRYSDERYSMLDTIRDYSAECLERSGETSELRRRHAEWFVALADKVSNEARSVRESAQIGLLRTNVDNFRAALAWLRSSGSTEVELRLALALFDLWIIAGYVDEGRRVVDLALTTYAGHRSELRARALKIAGDLALDKGDYPAANALLQQAIALYEALSLNGRVASCLSDLGHVAKCEHRYDRAEALFERSIGLARALKAKDVLANSMLNLGDCLVAKGDFARAELLCRQSVELNLELQDALGVGVCQFSLALAVFFQERYGEALDLLKQSLETFHQFQYVVGVGYALEGLAALAAVGGRREDAARLLGVAQVQFENAGASLEPSEQALHDRTISTLRADMGEARLAEVLATGRRSDLEKSIAHALLTMHWSDEGMP